MADETKTTTPAEVKTRPAPKPKKKPAVDRTLPALSKMGLQLGHDELDAQLDQARQHPADNPLVLIVEAAIADLKVLHQFFPK